MFTYEQIERMNKTEAGLYRYLMANHGIVPFMTIRELAEATNVSTATLLRFFNKMGYDSYNEFKKAWKKQQETVEPLPKIGHPADISLFFEVINSSSFEKKIENAVELIQAADVIMFIGVGPSGAFAKYCARYFTDLGIFAIGLGDSYYPVKKFKFSNAVIFAISESGESQDLLNMITNFQSKDYRILSITHSSESSLAKISDWNFSYKLNSSQTNGGNSQIPALFVVESIAKRI